MRQYQYCCTQGIKSFEFLFLTCRILPLKLDKDPDSRNEKNNDIYMTCHTFFTEIVFLWFVLFQSHPINNDTRDMKKQWHLHD